MAPHHLTPGERRQALADFERLRAAIVAALDAHDLAQIPATAAGPDALDAFDARRDDARTALVSALSYAVTTLDRIARARPVNPNQ